MESLVATLRPALRQMGNTRVRNRSIRIRAMIAYLDAPMNLPSVLVPISDPEPASRARNVEDSPALRGKIQSEITGRSKRRLRQLLYDAREMNPQLHISCELRESPVDPAFKLCILNDEVALLGLYGIKGSEFLHDGENHRNIGRLILWSITRRCKHDCLESSIKHRG